MASNLRFISAPYVIDRKLYKYYSNIGYATDCIKHRRIHLDNPHTFNDPFEAKFGVFYYTYRETVLPFGDILDTIFEYIKNLTISGNAKHNGSILSALVRYKIKSAYVNEQYPISKAIKIIYESLDDINFSFKQFCDEINAGFVYTVGFIELNCKISCFSEVNNSILMWSYYEKNHKGVCLEFDLTRLTPNNTLNKKILNNITKVHYSPIRADLQYSIQDKDEYNFLVSKADAWAHEQEWRIICETDEEFLPFDCVSKIYLGVNFNKDTTVYRNLEQLCKKHVIDIVQCRLSRESYKIEFETIYDSQWGQYIKAFQLK